MWCIKISSNKSGSRFLIEHKKSDVFLITEGCAMDKYLFSIPDSYVVRLFNRTLLVAMKKYPEWFYDDFIIDTAYGCSPSCIWNGGRGDTNIGNREGWTNEVLRMYTNFGVKYRLVFTNLLLRKEHLNDIDGNELCKMADRLGYDVMVSLPMMADYLKSRYRNIRVCWSTTTKYGNTTDEIIAKINQLSKDTLVVLPYQYNNKPEIEKLAHPENIEVLVNEMCIDNCPFRRKHWEKISKEILNGFGKDGEETSCYFQEQYVDLSLHREHLIRRERFPWYRDRGIIKFKISGRDDQQQCYESYVNYMVKPEKADVFNRFAEDYGERFLNSGGNVDDEM